MAQRRGHGRRPATPGARAASRARGRVLLSAVGLVAVLLAGCSVGTSDRTSVTPSPSEVWARATATPAAAVLAGPTPGAVPADAPQLADQVGDALSAAALGSHVGALVLDTSDATAVLEQRADDGFVPASVTKLVVAAAALDALGPQHRFVTRVVAGDTPGEVVVVGGGDPLLTAGPARSTAVPALVSIDTLAEATVTALRERGQDAAQVHVDDDLFAGPAVDPDWRRPFVALGIVGPVSALSLDGGRRDPDGTARTSDPALFAGAALADRLSSAGVAVDGPVTRADARSAPAGTATGTPAPTTATDPTATGITATDDATAAASSASPSAAPARPWLPGELLAEGRSAPLAEIVEHTLTISDNDAAEVLARHVALASGAPGTSDAAGPAVLARLAGLGLDPAGSVLADGSGLAAGTRLTPELIARLLVLATSPQRPQLGALGTGLAVAGFTGSLQDRFPATGSTKAGIGVVRAKTGTLTGVSGLAGLITARDGVTYAFAFLADRAGATPAARAALDRAAASLAACGCSRTVEP